MVVSKSGIKRIKDLGMALTRQLKLLIQDTLTIRMPMVLIGPTGTGKTTFLQRLFSTIVFNCSNDSDTIGLIENYTN